MPISPLILDMLSENLKDAVVDAQTRLADDTIMARVNIGLVDIEVSGVIVAPGLSEEDAIDELNGMT